MSEAATFDAFERDSWAGRAEAYDRGFAKITAKAVEPLLDAGGVARGVRVLDMGCGPGGVTAAALARSALVTAADAEPAMIRVITERFPGLRAEHAILPALPFADGQFDVAVGNFVINHVGDPAAAVTSLARVIRPGGRVALTCWYPPRMQATRIFEEAMSAAGETSADGVPKTIPFRQYAEPTPFTGLLARAGLTEVRTEQLEWRHDVDPDQWWTDVIEGTARTAAVIARLDADATRRVKKEYDHIIDPFRHSDGRVSLAAAALLATGTVLADRTRYHAH